MTAVCMPPSLGSIPAVTAGPITEEQAPVLLWAHTGAATVDAAGDSFRLHAGEAIWVPPGIRHRTRTDDGAVVLPIFPAMPRPRDALAEVRVVAVPPGWEDWLISQFDFNRFHTLGWRSDVRPLLGPASPGPSGAERGRDVSPSPSLPMPFSREARAVAQLLLRSPGSSQQVADLAESQSISARTLQRQFQAETGMPLSAWRTRARVVVAARLLAEGGTAGRTGRQVGFATPAGFSRAFREHLGLSPSRYAAQAHPVRDSTAPPAQADEVAGHLLAPASTAPPVPPPIPARQPWSWAEEAHVLWWACRGHVRIRIGTRDFTLEQGQAIWLPAGLCASVHDLARGSILLPLGNHHGSIPLGADDLRVFTFPQDAEAFLLHTVVVEYFFFRAETEQPRLVDEMFREQFVLERGGASHGLTGAVATIARALHRDPADPRSLGDWAVHLRLPPQRLGHEFLVQTGTTFPRWRAQLRMTIARRLLLVGDPPHEVARVLGYTRPGYFRSMFARAHGITPRAYQRRVSRRMAADD